MLFGLVLAHEHDSKVLLQLV